MAMFPYKCDRCGKPIKDSFLCECGGTMRPTFRPFAILGLEWNWEKGYKPGVDDPVKEVKFDMKKLEQSMTEEGNQKKYYEKKKALEAFAEAHEDILK